MAATALTLTTALANAQAVYNDKTRCLNRHFQLDENFENQATIEQLMAQVDKLPAKEDKTEKKRLVVFLNLLYPTPKKQDGKEKEKPEKPETLEDLKQAMLAMCKASASSKTAPSRVGSPLEIAKQIQKELSILLFCHEFLEFQREYTEKVCKKTQQLLSLQMTSEGLPLDEPEMFALFVQLKFSPVKNVMTGNMGFYSNLAKLSPKVFNKLVSLIEHPNPLISNFAKKTYLAKKCIDEFEATGLFDKSQAYIKYIERLLLKNSHNSKIVSEICPELIAFFETLSSSLEEETSKNLACLVENRLLEFFTRFPKEEILQRYPAIYKEFQENQAKLLADKKETLAKKFSVRLGDFFLPKTHRREDFPTPDELLKPPVEPKKPSKKPADTKDKKPKEKQQVDEVEVSKETVTKMDEKETIKAVSASKKPTADDSFVKKILRSAQPIVYDDRVKDWQNTREQTPGGYTPDAALWKHAFTALVDPFVGNAAYSFKDVWSNPSTGNDDPCYCILADVTFPSGETVPGVFQYTFDAKGVCYHRWFGKMSNIDRLDKAIHQIRHKISFPPLIRAKKPSVEEIDNIVFEVDPYFGSITFNDKKNGLKIKIYKVED